MLWVDVFVHFTWESGVLIFFLIKTFIFSTPLLKSASLWWQLVKGEVNWCTKFDTHYYYYFSQNKKKWTFMDFWLSAGIKICVFQWSKSHNFVAAYLLQLLWKKCCFMVFSVMVFSNTVSRSLKNTGTEKNQ